MSVPEIISDSMIKYENNGKIALLAGVDGQGLHSENITFFFFFLFFLFFFFSLFLLFN